MLLLTSGSYCPTLAAWQPLISSSSYGVSDAELARRIGISRQNLNLWRTHGVRGLPARATLEGIATVIGRTYQSVLEAALRDAGYLDGPWTTTDDH